MQHAMLIPEIHEFSMLVKMRQRARSLDAFSHLYRDFQYRLISTYTFSESSRHSEHNDMRQGYVLINRLGCRAPWRVRWRHPHVRGRKKLSNHFTALHPRYSYSGGSPGLGTTGKFRQTFIENRTPSQVQDYLSLCTVQPVRKTTWVGRPSRLYDHYGWQPWFFTLYLTWVERPATDLFDATTTTSFHRPKEFFYSLFDLS